MMVLRIWLFTGCGAKESDTAQAVDTEVQVEQKGVLSVATDARSFENRYGQQSTLQYWYPTSEERDSLHVYDDIVESQAQDGGAPDCTQTRPVVVFSHGNGGMRYQSFFLMEYLASHGFVVVAPDHVGNTAFDMDGATRAELIFRRPEDIIDSFDTLLENTRFEGCIDADAGYAVMGHSFGGYTTLALSGAQIDTEAVAQLCSIYPDAWLCEGVQTFAEENGAGIYDRRDPRIWAGVALTPAGYEALSTTLKDIEIPMLVFGGGLDDLTPMEWMVKPIYDNIAAPKNMAEFPFAGHYSFTNACDILPTYPDCGAGYLSPPAVHEVTNTLTTAFLFKELGGYRGWETAFPIDSTDFIWHD